MHRKGLMLVQYLAGIVIGQILINVLLKSEPRENEQENNPESLGSPSSSPEEISTKTQIIPELLMIGVMTTSKFLSSRACAVYQTWAQHIQGKVLFYAETGADLSNVPCALPIVRLHGVTNTYPPQKKSFMMLRHMQNNFGDQFRWFMRADDDVYINWNTIHNLLRSIQSQNLLHYIGQAGTGTIEEHGRLGLGRDQNFCMGGPGVILSAETLRQIRPHIKTCLKNLHSNHEDVEVGRCLHKHLGLSCSWAYEMMSLFYHSPSKKVPSSKYSLINKAVTLHPVKETTEMFDVHLKILSLRRKQLQERLITLTIQMDLIDNGKNRVMIPTGNWNTIVSRNYYSVENTIFQTKYPSHLAEGLSSSINHLMTTINSVSRERGRFIEFRDLYYGYSSLVPNRGIVHILDIFMLYKQFQKRMNQKVRRHVHLEQRFMEPRARLLDSSSIDHNHRVNIIIPLYGREEQFERFLEHYETNFLRSSADSRKSLRLIVVLFSKKGESPTRESVRLRLAELSEKYPGTDTILVPASGTFSRAVGLDLGTKLCSNNDLMLFTDVDILFTSRALTSIRLLTHEAQSIYFPIVFSLFKSDNLKDLEGPGYWRLFGYGVVALYKSDYIGMNLSIRGWGKEDVDLFDRFLERKDLTVVRACDPDFVHVYHPVTCDKGLNKDQFEMCLSSKANNYLSSKEAAKIIIENDILKQL